MEPRRGGLERLLDLGGCGGREELGSRSWPPSLDQRRLGLLIGGGYRGSGVWVGVEWWLDPARNSIHIQEGSHPLVTVDHLSYQDLLRAQSRFGLKRHLER